MSSSFKNKSMLSMTDFLKIQPQSLMEQSFTSLLFFLEEHFPSKKQILEEHSVWNPDISVYLGNNVLNQLNFISNSSESILSYFQKTFTPLGKRGIVERLLYPLSDIDILSMRVYKLEKVIQMEPTKKKQIENYLKQISDLQRIHHKFFSYNLNAIDILNLYQSYTRIIDIMELYETNDIIKDNLINYLEEYFQYLVIMMLMTMIVMIK
jgi:DNA mismatch repair ATPase MutS